MTLSARAGPADPAKIGVYSIIRELAAEPVPTYAGRTEGGERALLECLGEDGDAARIAHLVRLQHPNLARVRELVVDPEFGKSIVVDFIEGATLEELERAAPIPLDAKLRVLVDVLNGLSALHGHCDEGGAPLGLLHGDVSAGSIIIGLDGTARLIHLALPAAALARARAPVAPELERGSAPDARSDLYSVGVLLIDALRAASDPWAPALVDALRKATDPDPEQRFATAAELAAEVRRAARPHIAPPAKVAACVRERLGPQIAERREHLSTAPPLDRTVISKLLSQPPPVASEPPPPLVIPRAPAAPSPMNWPEATPTDVTTLEEAPVETPRVHVPARSVPPTDDAAPPRAVDAPKATAPEGREPIVAKVEGGGPEPRARASSSPRVLDAGSSRPPPAPEGTPPRPPPPRPRPSTRPPRLSPLPSAPASPPPAPPPPAIEQVPSPPASVDRETPPSPVPAAAVTAASVPTIRVQFPDSTPEASIDAAFATNARLDRRVALIALAALAVAAVVVVAVVQATCSSEAARPSAAPADVSSGR